MLYGSLANTIFKKTLTLLYYLLNFNFIQCLKRE